MKLHPLKQQQEMSEKYRQIGLGIMGAADLFIKMGIRYGSDESLEIIHQIGHIMINEALQESALLAKEYGTFPAYNKTAVLSSPFLLENATDETLELVKKYGLRNSQLLTIAPTGSIATLIGCSNGVEPIFQISYTRKTESLYGTDTYYKVYADVISQLMSSLGIASEEELPNYVVTSSTLDYRERIAVQAAWQHHIDASISSTVNVPYEFTIEEVEDLYMHAWEQGLKGITIYRDGSARVGILTTEETKTEIKSQDDINREIAQKLTENPNICPKCGGTLVHSGGCSECLDCGYSPCSI